MSYREPLPSVGSCTEDVLPLTGIVHPVAPYWGRLPSGEKAIVGKVIRLLVFLICTGLLCIVPLYMRNKVYVESMHPIQVSDMRLMSSHVSTTWCQAQTLTMNTSFNAVMVDNDPVRIRDKRTVSIRMNLTLSDEVKRYWGFYLLKGSKVNVTTCARWPGAEVIIVEGVPSLRTCSIVESQAEGSQGDDDSSLAKDDDPVGLMAKKRGELVDVMSRWGHADFSERFKSLMKAWGKEIGSNNTDATAAKVLEQFVNMSKTFAPRSLRVKREDMDNGGEVLDDYDETFNGWISAATAQGTFNKTKAANESRSEEFSSFSSSEEALKRCKGVLVHEQIEPTPACEFKHSFDSTLNITVEIPKDGFYYFVFGSENEITDNPVQFQLDIKRVKFDVHPTGQCHMASNCTFPLGFWSNDKVILWKPLGPDGHDWNESFWVQNVCVPRTSIYVIMLALVPLVTLLCAML